MKEIEHKRLLKAILTFSILIIIVITLIDWAVTNYYYFALLGSVSLKDVKYWFSIYQFGIFIILNIIIIFFIVAILINYFSLKYDIEQKSINYFRIFKYLPAKCRKEIILICLSYAILFIFNFEDILWFRLFYGPNMSECIDDLYCKMWWLDLHMAGLIGIILGFGGATSLSVMITALIGYIIFIAIWYHLLKDKLLLLNLIICAFYIFGIDLVFLVLKPPFPYLRITLMEIMFFITFFIIVLKTKN
ncbi:MAG: hypothetical protein ACP6IY_05995 [Promethearchaeia archaeon]